MSKEFAKAFYHSRAWKKVRELVMRKNQGLCVRCRERGVLTPADAVHHKIPLTPGNINDPSITLDPDKLEPLCKDCHEEAHRKLGYGALNHRADEKPRVAFDENGNVIRLKED